MSAFQRQIDRSVFEHLELDWKVVQEIPSMSGSALYLIIMLGVVAVVALISVPSLIRQKCHKCGARNSLEATHCIRCGVPFPRED